MLGGTPVNHPFVQESDHLVTVESSEADPHKTVYTANGLSDSVSVIDTACMCVTGEIAAGRGAHSIEVGHVD